MKQSRATSFLKSIVSTSVGFAVAMLANALVLPLFGWHPTLSDNLALTTIYTAISIARGYVMERAFEAMGWRTRMSAFALAVLAERQRQITVEGWTVEHDEQHEAGELAQAGAHYALQARRHVRTHYQVPAGDSYPLREHPDVWPWHREWFKPTGFRRDLVKAGALILAEGERFDRNRKRKPRAFRGGYQPEPGPLPPLPNAAAHVAQSLKQRHEHAGPSA